MRIGRGVSGWVWWRGRERGDEVPWQITSFTDLTEKMELDHEEEIGERKEEKTYVQTLRGNLT